MSKSKMFAAADRAVRVYAADESDARRLNPSYGQKLRNLPQIVDSQTARDGEKAVAAMSSAFGISDYAGWACRAAVNGDESNALIMARYAAAACFSRWHRTPALDWKQPRQYWKAFREGEESEDKLQEADASL